MTINDAKLTIQLTLKPEGEDLGRAQVGDKFKIYEVRDNIIKAKRVLDGHEIIILGDNGAKHFRICNECKTSGTKPIGATERTTERHGDEPAQASSRPKTNRSGIPVSDPSHPDYRKCRGSRKRPV